MAKASLLVKASRGGDNARLCQRVRHKGACRFKELEK
jgi:hypothetical protein